MQSKFGVGCCVTGDLVVGEALGDADVGEDEGATDGSAVGEVGAVVGELVMETQVPALQMQEGA